MKITSPTTLHVATLVGKLFLKITKSTIINNNKVGNSFNNLRFFAEMLRYHFVMNTLFCNNKNDKLLIPKQKKF